MVQQINSENDTVIRFGDAQMEVYQRESTQSKYDLVFNFSQNGQKLSLRLEYSTKLFKKETMLRLLKRYQSIVTKMVQDKNGLLIQVSEDEIEQKNG